MPVALVQGVGGELMKTGLILTVFCLLFAGAAFGQTAGAISSEAQMTVLPEHPKHADVHSMAADQSLVGGTIYTIEHGERPLWEFGPVSAPPRPLGDVAREYRQQHLFAKKAEVIMEKQADTKKQQ